MKKELFKMTCNFDFEEDGGLNIGFEIEANGTAEEVFGKKTYEEYLEKRR